MTILAGVSGSIAWVGPYLLFPILPSFTPYRPGIGLTIPLVEHIISFSMAWVIATALFLVLCNTHLLASDGSLKWNFSTSTVVSILVGALIGGAFAGAIAYGLAYSPLVDLILSFLDLQSSLPEPFVSIGFIAGIAILAGVVSSFAYVPEEWPMASTIAFVSQFSVSALLGRIVVGILSALLLSAHFVSAVLLTDIIGGFICGALAWYLCIGRKAA